MFRKQSLSSIYCQKKKKKKNQVTLHVVDGEIWIATHAQQLYQLKVKRENNQCMQETDFYVENP